MDIPEPDCTSIRDCELYNFECFKPKSTIRIEPNMMEKKSIWIINEYAGSPYHGMEFRHYYLGRELLELGYKVMIITAAYSHLFRKLPVVDTSFKFEDIDGITYLWVKVPRYPHAHHKKRVLKWLVYTSKLFFLPLDGLRKPDFIIVSPMQTLPVYPSFKICKRFTAKMIFEVKDIWPLSLIELGGYSENNLFIKFLGSAERFAIEKSDLLISVLPGYGKYLSEKGYSKDFLYLPNGIDINELNNAEPLDERIKACIPRNKFIVGYLGTVGFANALDSFIDAGNLLKDFKDIVLVIVGEGKEKERLMKRAQDSKNILFLPAVSKRQVQDLLKNFDVCFIGLRNQNLFNYGVSPNKLFDYMYSGKPILEAINTFESIIIKANCGIQVKPEDAKAIADGILRLYRMPEQKRKLFGENGKKYVLANHTYDKLAERLSECIESL